jgi:hypothetical protein
LAAVGVLGSAGFCSAAVITPAAYGVTSDPGNLNVVLTGAFDSQPTAEPTVGQAPGYVIGASPQVYAGPRTGYIDFGPDYASITLTGTYELLQKYGQTVGWDGLSWTWSGDKLLSTTADNTSAPDFGFMEPYTVSLQQANMWIQPWTGSVTPAAQYLLLTTPASGVAGNASVEWVFTGSVPEPASLSLLCAGGLVLLRKRRL